MPNLQAVLFDMGGTLEDVDYDDALRLQATRGLQAILARCGLDPGLKTADLCAVVKAGMKKYNAWREETEMELSPERMWSEFVLPDLGLPGERLAAAGEELACFYDLNFYRRTLRPETKPLLDALRQRGFRLGVVSNVYSRGAVPHNLARYGLTQYFQVVLASSVFGRRKPDTRIFLEASRLLELPPSACAYVGDTVSRDVVGARRAGYGMAIQIKSFLTAVADKETDTEQPDAVVENLLQVVDVVARSPGQSR